MSPHQRAFIWPASAVKSRRIRSARAAAAGSGIVVLRHAGAPCRRSRPSASAGRCAYGRADGRGGPARHGCAARRSGPGTPRAPPGSARRAQRPPACGGTARTVRIEGGAGDLQQRARPLDVAPASLLRLDERVDVHRVSLTKKAVARLRISTASRSRRFSRRNAASSWRSVLVSPPSRRVPASRSAWRTHSRTAVSVRSKSRATCPIERSPRWHSSTISALNSGVNDRARARLLAFHGLHDGHPLRGSAPDGGCPSKRASPGQRREDGPVWPGGARSADLSTQDRDLVAQDEDLGVLGRLRWGQQSEPAEELAEDQ